MSVRSPAAQIDTTAAASQATPRPALKPVVRAILDTRRCVPGAIFLVENVESFPLPAAPQRRVVRLILGDGDLCIQALLRASTHDRVGGRDGLVIGDYIRLGQFALHRMPIDETEADDGDDGSSTREMVCLLLDDFEVVGRDDAYLELVCGMEARRPEEEDAYARSGQTDYIEDSGLGIQELEVSGRETAADNCHPRTRANVYDNIEAIGDTDDEETDDDAFDEMPYPAKKATTSQPAEPPPDTFHHEPPAASMSASVPIRTSGPTPAAVFPKDWTDGTKPPPKLSPLRSIPHLPWKQNWATNVLAVVASLSPVEPSHLPPYAQCNARLADPSTTKRVLLTVFLDPAEFRPRAGAVVLLLGVKNHRFDGGSLKKYASDRPRDGSRWWFEDPSELAWCDVAGLKLWWEEQQQQQQHIESGRDVRTEG